MFSKKVMLLSFFLPVVFCLLSGCSKSQETIDSKYKAMYDQAVKMKPEEAVVALPELVVGVASVVLAILAIVVIQFNRGRHSSPQQIDNVQNFIDEKYLLKKLEGYAVDEGKEVEVNGETVKSYNHKFKEMMRVTETDFKKRQVDRGEKLKVFYKNSLIEKDEKISQKQRVENSYVYNALAGLQEIGLQAFFGSMSLSMILSNIANIIALDWIASKELVKKIREDNQIRMKGERKGCGTWHRRHGEWLACVCVMYLNEKCEGDDVDFIIEELNGIESVRDREKVLRDQEDLLIGPDALRIVKKLRTSKISAWCHSLVRKKPLGEKNNIVKQNKTLLQ